jgi:hypothetical protein
LPCDDAMGGWRYAGHERVFIVQSGLHWGSHRPRTRGVAVNFLEPHTERFEQSWSLYRALGDLSLPPPVIHIPQQVFIGLRLAFARKDASRSCTIEDAGEGKGRGFAFAWRHKRGNAEWEGDAVRTWPITLGQLSLGHGEAPDMVAELDASRLELEAMPDTIDTSIPFARDWA